MVSATSYPYLNAVRAGNLDFDAAPVLAPAFIRDGQPERAIQAALVPTIFHQPWWLDAASGGAWREARSIVNGQLVGRLPYLCVRKPGGLKALIMPPMTHALGPAVEAGAVTKDSSRALKEISITRDLIRQLPPAAHVWFQLHPGVGNTLAFEAAGFRTGVGFSTEIAPRPGAELWQQMRDKIRNVVRRASERLTVSAVGDPGGFMDFYESNLRERGLRNNYDRAVCEALIAACLRRGAGRLLMAADGMGDPQSAIFTIWDHATAYYFMTTRTLGSMNGATSLLVWHALNHAAMLGLNFDMDGIDVKKTALLATGFGGVIKPRYFVSKTSTLFEVGRSARRLIRRGVHRP